MWNRPGCTRATERDLAALADGSLQAGRRKLVERLVAASTELQLRLREQRRAVLAARSIGADRAPPALRMTPRTRTARRPARTRPLGLTLAGALAVLGCLWAVLGPEAAAPTVLQVAAVGVHPATALVSEPADATVTLPRVQAAGLPFPYWEDRFGWVATGARTDRLGGRLLTTVFYRRHGRLIAYTIVTGPPLRLGSGSAASTTRGHTALRSLFAGGRRIVVWLRREHTCVLSGTGVPTQALLELAAWRGHGELPS